MPNPKKEQLWQFFELALRDVGLTEDQITIVFQCHVYVVSGGSFFPGHRLYYLIYKLIHYIIKQKETKK